MKAGKFLALFSNQSISRKLLWVCTAICLTFALLGGGAFYSYRYILGKMEGIFFGQVAYIMKNGETNRGLAQLLSNTTLLTQIFFGDDEALETEGAKIIRDLNHIAGKNADAQVRAELDTFHLKIDALLEQCRRINATHTGIMQLNDEIYEILKSMNATVSDRLMANIMEGREDTALNRLPAMISEFNEMILKTSLAYARNGLDHFLTPEEKKKEGDLHAVLDDFLLKIQTLPAFEAEFGVRLTERLERYKSLLTEFHQVGGEFKKRLDEMNSQKKALLALMKQADENAAKNAGASFSQLTGDISEGVTAGGLMLLGVAVAIILFVLQTSRSVSSSLQSAMAGLDAACRSLFQASGEMSSISQEISTESSEQAASLEETSSSIEELSAMVNKHSESAGEAGRTVNNSARSLKEAADSMAQLFRSMNEISDASQESRNIIKTIEAIAFQTNLLALNAAVEAARAGEAGAGFAVVAEEVRTLALQSAEATKDITRIIEMTISRIHDGETLAGAVNKTFSRAKKTVDVFRVLAEEVLAGSVEQAEGMNQITQTVSQMNLVVQSSAAKSQGLLDTSGEMNAQAENMNQSVRELRRLVGGNRSRGRLHPNDERSGGEFLSAALQGEGRKSGMAA